MSKVDFRDITIPTGGDTADLETILEELSKRAGTFVPVPSRTVANQRLASCPPGTPLLVWRTDEKILEIHENVAGAAWEYLAGRQHGATIGYERVVPQAVDNPPSTLFTSGAGFIRQSDGWTAIDAGTVRFPATGMWLISGSFEVAGAASTLGRTFVQYMLNNQRIARQTVTGEDYLSLDKSVPASAGNEFKVLAYHAGGEDRTVTGTVQLTMLNAPRWKS